MGGFEAGLSGPVEPSLKYHPEFVRGLTPIPMKLGGGHCMPGSLTGAVSSQKVTEERKGWLSVLLLEIVKSYKEGPGFSKNVKV